MVWVIGILKFLFGAVGMFSTYLLAFNVIKSVINPQIGLNEKGEAIDKTANSRYFLSLISSICWALVIAL